MIRLFFKENEKLRKIAESLERRAPVKKLSAGGLWLRKDMSELNLSESCGISFPNEMISWTLRSLFGLMKDFLEVRILCSPLKLPLYTLMRRPGSKCKTKVYHPSIDLVGNVRLNILQENWHKYHHLWTVSPIHATQSQRPSQSWCSCIVEGFFTSSSSYCETCND